MLLASCDCSDLIGHTGSHRWVSRRNLSFDFIGNIFFLVVHFCARGFSSHHFVMHTVKFAQVTMTNSITDLSDANPWCTLCCVGLCCDVFHFDGFL